ncbi:PqqD family peptide modification chaperone [Microbacterium sp. W1N]|uniref:PqqD family peptide modification chaperone n=1 Tax=Microbacterium festucae TaxID=2977531 RepID=UPI0021C02E96|nr:PqqD family peptide modification chaperone [Microbacterium festucae]MCT9819061.1 PqqD family peptide modification chaperone [Microbacterium festucae]
MATTLLIEALGAIVALDLEGVDESVTDAVRSAWRDAVAHGREPELVVSVAEIAAHAASTEQVLSDLSQRVTLEAITARKGELWMLHATGLALPDGRVIVLVGPSGRGKTTAARALGAHLGYVSDETVGIDRDGRVHPYRKPLSVIEGAGFKAQLAPSELGLAPLPAVPLQVAAVVLLDRQADAADVPVVEPVDLGDAVDELVTQTSFLASMASPLQWLAALLERTGGMRRVVYREAAALHDVVDDLLAPGASTTWAPAAREATVASAGAYSRGEVQDAVALAHPDRVVVLQPGDGAMGMVRVLGGIAPALWDAADDARIDDLVDAAVAHFGAPEGQDVRALVAQAVAELVEVGALRRGEERVWQVAPDVAWHGDHARVVVLDLAQDDVDVHALEGSAAVIWMALAEGGGTVDEISARVAEDAGVPALLLRDEVARFHEVLSAAGLVRYGSCT